MAQPSTNLLLEAFQNTKHGYSEAGKTAQALGYWQDVYPQHARLTAAYITEAFAQLGCDLAKVKPGDPLPPIVQALDTHKKLIHRFLETLAFVGAVDQKENGEFVRSNKPSETKPAESIYNEIIDLHPAHSMVSKLIRVIGSQLAGCLRGDVDALALLFGNKDNKKLLSDMYEFWPLLRAPTLLLGKFLEKAYPPGGRKFRILEVGAGSGGTTRHIVERLQQRGIEFEYVFTDISTALVAAAKRQFKKVEGMKFEVLDVEKPPKSEHEGGFDCIISTNCIHATKNLDVTLRHLRRMVKDDGVVALVETTRRDLLWLDVVVGFFEGWWLFDDGRTYALVDEGEWATRMKKAGFGEVQWTGEEGVRESETVRVVAAFAKEGSIS